jgi:mannose-1-phosphate guanylyltransferase/phosphomannomutase
MKVVIMAGGKGTRLRPLTSELPKPLVPLANKSIIEYLMDILGPLNPDEVIVTTKYLSHMLKEALGDGSRYGIPLRYSVEQEARGTAGGVKLVERYLDGDFMVLSGDVLTDMDLRSVYDFHVKKGALVTIALKRERFPLEFGIVITDKSQRITQFLEKPGWGQVFSDTINTGTYVLNYEILDYIEKDKELDFSQDIFPMLLNMKKKLYGCIQDCYWCDIGTTEKYLQANWEILAGKSKLKLKFKTNKNSIYLGQDITLGENVELHGPILIGNNVIIEDGCKIYPYTVIGDNVFIGKNCFLKGAIVWQKVFIEKNATLMNCVVANEVKIGSKGKICPGAIIGANSTIGNRSTVAHEIKIWPNRHIEECSTVNMNVKEGAKWSRRLFSQKGVVGEINSELTPEFLTKLGSAIGTFFGPEKQLALLSTTEDSLIKHALISGLISAGINVMDLGDMPPPLIYTTIPFFKNRGGIIITPWGEKVSIECFDSGGLDIDEKAKRKIENIFFKDDLNRVKPKNVGSVLSHNPFKRYEALFLSKIKTSEAMRKLRIVLVSRPEIASLLGLLGCEIINLGFKTLHSEDIPSKVGQAIKIFNANLGIIFSEDLRYITCVDDKGVVIDGDKLLIIFIQQILEAKKGNIVTSLMAPSYITELAKQYGVTHIITRSSFRAVEMGVIKNKGIFGGNITGGYIFPEFHQGYDGIYATAKLLEFISKGLRLSQLVAEIPSYAYLRTKFACPFESRGKLIRQIIEEFKHTKVDTLEGVKIIYPDGWVLIIPDGMEPYFWIYSNAKEKSIAEKYMKNLQTVAKRILNN